MYGSLARIGYVTGAPLGVDLRELVRLLPAHVSVIATNLRRSPDQTAAVLLRAPAAELQTYGADLIVVSEQSLWVSAGLSAAIELPRLGRRLSVRLISDVECLAQSALALHPSRVAVVSPYSATLSQLIVERLASLGCPITRVVTGQCQSDRAVDQLGPADVNALLAPAGRRSDADLVILLSGHIRSGPRGQVLSAVNSVPVLTTARAVIATALSIVGVSPGHGGSHDGI